MTAYASWSGAPKRPAWVAIIKDKDHGKILWSGSTSHSTPRAALAEAEAKREELTQEQA